MKFLHPVYQRKESPVPAWKLCSQLWVILLCTCLLLFTMPLTRSNAAAGYKQQYSIDLQGIQTARQGLENALLFIDDHPEIFQPVQIVSPRPALKRSQRMTAWQTWQFFLDHILYLDNMGRVYSEQYLTPVDMGKGVEPFQVAFTAFVTQYRFALEFVARMENNPDMHVLLNEPVPELGLNRGSYSHLKFRFLNVLRGAEFARLYALHSYYQTRNNGPQVSESLAEDMNYLWNAGKGEGPLLTVRNGLRIVSDLGFSVWFPVQKNVSQLMGTIKVWRPGSSLINEQQIRALAPELQPGDILLQRREWYATNIGIPGFWTHAALYIGNDTERDLFFTDPSLKAWLQVKGCEDGRLETMLRKRYPKRYQQSLLIDSGGNVPRVLEAIADGVSFTTLEHSLAADSLAVLRPNLPQDAIAQAIIRAFSYSTRPYDFNFDFRTDAALVCSELVYKAYEKTDGGQGLSLPLTEIMGRPLLSPNQIARLFDQEYDHQHPQLSLVLFLDGREQSRQAVPGSTLAFRKSWQRPKWHVFIQE